jgi:hypothetical protein
MSMTLSLDTPLLSLGEYARRTGISVESVRKQMDKGHLPFIQHENRGTRYINMLQLTQRCADANADKAWN